MHKHPVFLNKVFYKKEQSIENFSKNDFNLKRNYLFLRDFTYFSKFFFSFIKKLSKYQESKRFIFNNQRIFLNKLKKNFTPIFLFIAEKNDSFFYNLFDSFTQHLDKVSLLIEWNVSRFFYFLNKKKSLLSQFYPILFISPYLFYNKEFMSIFNMLSFFPVFFFFEKASKFSDFQFYNKNVFPIFLGKKNNLKFLLIFFKLFLKFF